MKSITDSPIDANDPLCIRPPLGNAPNPNLSVPNTDAELLSFQRG